MKRGMATVQSGPILGMRDSQYHGIGHAIVPQRNVKLPSMVRMVWSEVIRNQVAVGESTLPVEASTRRLSIFAVAIRQL